MGKNSAQLFRHLTFEKTDLDARLFYVSEEKFNSKLEIDKWSIAQIVLHLYMAESQTLQAIKWRISNKKDFPKVSFLSVLKVFNISIFFALKIKMKAPSFVSPSNDFIPKEKLLEDWQKTRNEWDEFVFKFPKELEGKVIYKHPLLGYMSLALVLKFMNKHFLRHKIQLLNLIEDSNPTINLLLF